MIRYVIDAFFVSRPNEKHGVNEVFYAEVVSNKPQAVRHLRLGRHVASPEVLIIT